MLMRLNSLLPLLCLSSICGLVACSGGSPKAPSPHTPVKIGTATPYAQPPVPTIVDASGHIPGSATAAGTEVTYKVENGDTLLAIAARFGTTVDAIVQRN